jgi:hypothetical protein
MRQCEATTMIRLLELCNGFAMFSAGKPSTYKIDLSRIAPLRVHLLIPIGQSTVMIISRSQYAQVNWMGGYPPFVKNFRSLHDMRANKRYV